MVQSTLFKKVLMSLSGLFLVMFLVGHLLGNLQLLIPNTADAARLQFNAYAHFMTTNPIVKILSYFTYFFILLHILYALLLTITNKAARPIGYARSSSRQKGVSWSSKNMGILGTLILIFLVIHLKSFWYKMHWGDIPMDSAGYKDLYSVVEEAYRQLWYVLLYVVSMIFLGYHLAHGFSSAFQSLGLYHRRYTPFVKWIGKGFALVVPALFAMIPIVMYLRT